MSSHDTHEAEDASHYSVPKSKSSFTAAFWFVALLVGLFIAALNFIDVMGNGEHEKEPMATEEASSNGTLQGESGSGRDKQEAAQSMTPAATADTAHSGSMH